MKRVLRNLRKRWLYFLINKVYVGTKHFKIKLKLVRKLGFEIGDNTKIVGPFNCYAKSLKIGSNCWIGRNFFVDGNGEVVIGDNCDFGPEILFLTGGHNIGDSNRRAGVGKSFTIKVESGCWVCARTVITNNVLIRSSSVIAATSFVNKNIDDNCLAGGVPCRKIKDLE